MDEERTRKWHKRIIRRRKHYALCGNKHWHNLTDDDRLVTCQDCISKGKHQIKEE